MPKEQELSDFTKKIIIFIVSTICVFFVLFINDPIDFNKKYVTVSDCVREECAGDARIGEECICLEYGEPKSVPYNPLDDVFTKAILSLVLSSFIYWGIDRYRTYQRTGH